MLKVLKAVLFTAVLFSQVATASVRVAVPNTGWVQIAVGAFTMQNLTSSAIMIQPSAADPGAADLGTNAFRAAPGRFLTQNVDGATWWARATSSNAAIIVEDF